MRLFILFIIIGFSTKTFSQEVDIQKFTMNDVITGNDVNLGTYSNNKAVVLLFVSNECPYSIYYTERIRAMVNTYAPKGIVFLLINSHKDSSESPAAMKSQWASWAFDIPYLSDKSQELKKSLNVEKSPTVVVLKPIGSGYTNYYSGKIDNNPQVASDVKEAYLTDNLNSLLANRPPAHPNNRSIGCMIRQ